jgi:selenoprotein W-related protein
LLATLEILGSRNGPPEQLPQNAVSSMYMSSSYSVFLLPLVAWWGCQVDAFGTGGQQRRPRDARGIGAVHRPVTDLATRADVFQIRIDHGTERSTGLRAFWTAQELLTTFRDDRALGAVTVVSPNSSATQGEVEQVGRFVVSCSSATTTDEETTVLWSCQPPQADDGRFFEMKVLKQLVRDRISPARNLGHSDAADRVDPNEPTVLDLTQRVAEPPVDTTLTLNQIDAPTPHVSITYCTGCGWLLRAAYLAQELVLAFDDSEIAAVSLVPSRPPAKGGAFVVTMDETILWDRTAQGRFPETEEITQGVRDLLGPSKDPSEMEDLDDEASAEARQFFGVL